MSYSKELDFGLLVGKTLVEVRGKAGDERLTFITDTGERYVLYHEQDCCEHVYLEDVTGDLNDLIGAEIRMAEVESNYEDVEYGTQTWTFYKLGTLKGYVTLRWLGESNGYYSESVSFVREEGGGEE